MNNKLALEHIEGIIECMIHEELPGMLAHQRSVESDGGIWKRGGRGHIKSCCCCCSWNAAANGVLLLASSVRRFDFHYLFFEFVELFLGGKPGGGGVYKGDEPESPVSSRLVIRKKRGRLNQTKLAKVFFEVGLAHVLGHAADKYLGRSSRSHHHLSRLLAS